jgi:hypothetical protein
MQTHISFPVRALLLILPLVVSVPLRGQNAPEPLIPGEKLTYDITWSVFHGGEVTSTLRSGGAPDTYDVTTTARSAGVVSLLINVNDELHSFFNAQTLCSQRITKKINEGTRHKDTLIVFDYIRRLALLDERDLSLPGAPAKHAENEIPPCVEDVVTGYYYLRRQHLEIGHTIELPVNDGSKTQQVVVEVQAREKVQTPLGTFDAFRVEPKVFNSLFKRKGRMLIWFSADDQQLPLRIKAMISLGSITGVLRSVSHVPPNASPAKP